jgi:hypothetical protein
MEELDAYLARKGEEIALLGDCLDSPPALPTPTDPEGVIAAKFRLAALLRAQHAHHNWAATETHWHEAELDCAPYQIAYRYQRFDEAITGPPIYRAVARRAGQDHVWTTYASCGMAAITAVILSLSRAVDAANIHMGPGAYFETAHLIRAYSPNLRLLSDGAAIATAEPLPRAANIVILDSFAPSGWFDLTAARRLGPIDFAIVDTTCLAASSGHIARAIAWADHEGVPLVLVRSHVKLDMLGTEYGRLGSAVFVLPRGVRRIACVEMFQRVALGARDAIRLTGGAALPIALPPFTAHPRHGPLARRRHARLLANMRHVERGLHVHLDSDALESFSHGLFCTIAPPGAASRDETRPLVEALTARLNEAGVPARRAGSFGFDFVAVDEFSDVWRNREAIRLSMADLPVPCIERLVDTVTGWAESLGLSRHSMTMPG